MRRGFAPFSVYLWFIVVLFVISLTVLPLWGGRHTELSRTARLSRFLAHPAGWLVAGFVIMLAEGLPGLAGKNLVYYLVFFVLGYVTMCSDKFMDIAKRWRWPALIMGIAATLWWVTTGEWRDGLADPSVALAGVVYAGMLARWLVIVGLLGLGRTLLNRPSRALPYLAEGSYPVCILHQTVIVILAFYVVGFDVAWPVQWTLLLVSSVVMTFLCYEAIRRVGWLRLLLGMRPRHLRCDEPPPAQPQHRARDHAPATAHNFGARHGQTGDLRQRYRRPRT